MFGCSPVPSENFARRYKKNGGNAVFLTRIVSLHFSVSADFRRKGYENSRNNLVRCVNEPVVHGLPCGNRVRDSGETPNGLSASATLPAAERVSMIFSESPIPVPRTPSAFQPCAGFCAAITRSNSLRIRVSPFPVQKTQSAFHRHAQQNAFRSHARQRSRSFARWNQSLQHTPSSPTGFAEPVCDDFPILHKRYQAILLLFALVEVVLIDFLDFISLDDPHADVVA